MYLLSGEVEGKATSSILQELVDATIHDCDILCIIFNKKTKEIIITLAQPAPEWILGKYEIRKNVYLIVKKICVVSELTLGTWVTFLRAAPLSRPSRCGETQCSD
jgi:hypothetical protein